MEPTTCLFIGGAKHKTYVSGEFQKLKQARMVMSVQNDFQTMIEFAAAQSYELGIGDGEVSHLLASWRFATNVCHLKFSWAYHYW